jgi:hypothetical protein
MFRISISLAIALILPAAVAQVSAEPDAAEDRERFIREVLIPERLKLIDGDIAVPEDFDEDARATYEPDLWPDGVVPYEFDSSVNATNRSRMLAAMAEWESLANVDFVPRDGENDYIRIIADSANISEFVGHQGGRQRVWITSWTVHGTLVHELGHVLGYYHEQSRGDRNQFVTINFNNVSQTACSDSAGNPVSCNSQFTIRPGTGGEHGPYDFGSVMHYSACAFSACTTCAATNTACTTINVLPPNQRNRRSSGSASAPATGTAGSCPSCIRRTIGTSRTTAARTCPSGRS